jgi:hypothetical protein
MNNELNGLGKASFLSQFRAITPDTAVSTEENHKNLRIFRVLAGNRNERLPYISQEHNG